MSERTGGAGPGEDPGSRCLLNFLSERLVIVGFTFHHRSLSKHSQNNTVQELQGRSTRAQNPPELPEIQQLRISWNAAAQQVGRL